MVSFQQLDGNTLETYRKMANFLAVAASNGGRIARLRALLRNMFLGTAVATGASRAILHIRAVLL